MGDKIILENCGMLLFIPDCYKDQNMCNKAVDNCACALVSVSDCYNTKEMCDKAISIYPSIIQLVPD